MSIAVSARCQVTASLGFDNGIPSVVCASETSFKGSIKSDKPRKVQYRFVRSDGVLLPVETIDFSASGTKDVTTKWTLNGPPQEEFSGWVSLKVVYPVETETDKVEFKFVCDPTKPDLAVKIRSCPASARPGGELKSSFKVRAFNYGGVDIQDAAIDITLRKDTTCRIPAPQAVYSPHYYNGALLLGGHEKISLKAGHKAEVKLAGQNTIPADTPDGDYFLCATIDAGDKIKESNEANNCSCCPIKITSVPAKPDLMVERFTMKGWGKCEAKSPIVTFEVTVKNIGGAASPAMPDKALVQVADTDEKSWSGSAGLGAIPPGGRQTVTIPVYYYEKKPDHMLKAAPHPFRATIDPLNLLDESSKKNNKSDIIYLDFSSVCNKDKQ